MVALVHGHPYQAFYCEENIWHLAHRTQRPGDLVLVLANAAGGFAMFGQRAAPDDVTPLVWDYHVVLARLSAAQPSAPAPPSFVVLDLDSRLPFGCSAEEWTSRSFPAVLDDHPALQPRVRAVPAERYLDHFGSDRSHMRGEDGTWVADPPMWDAIRPGAPTLDRLRDVEDPFLAPSMPLKAWREVACVSV